MTAGLVISALLAFRTLAAPYADSELPTPLSLRPCSDDPQETFTFFDTDGRVAQGGSCLDGANGLTMAPCSTSSSQRWTWQTDGTVESVGLPGKCWSVKGAGMKAGTDVILHDCGHSTSLVPPNNIFSRISGRRVQANESGLCMSPLPPPTSSHCDDDIGCSLNGQCRPDGSCQCRPPWRGDQCDILRVRPVQSPIQGYGMQPNLTAWGGNALLGSDGLYHLIVAEMAYGCPLSTWTKNSQCIHATSKQIQGPYKRQGVAVPIWCHNPQVVQLPDGSYALFHIGTGTGGSPSNCTAPLLDSPQEWSATHLEAGSTVHIAADLNGPWQALLPNPLPSCNNPAPFVSSNGTIFIVCGASMYSAPKVTGPYNKVADFSHSGGPKGTYEDPLLYLDKQSNFHLLYHVYNTNEARDTCVNSTVSAHVFSEDGFVWHTSPNMPYTTQVLLSLGSTITVSTRERPKLLFDETTGEPAWLFNGVCHATACPDGPPTGCVDCKYDSWDYWMAQQLDLTPET